MNAELYRSRLQARLDDLLRRHEKITGHLQNRDRTPPADSAELAQFLQNDEVLEALDGSARDELDALQAAFERLDDGSYGTCVRCGEPIPEGRLEALPATPFCVRCAEAVAAG